MESKINIYTIDINSLPEQEVLAFGYQGEMLIGYLDISNEENVYCENDNEILEQVTKYILLSELEKEFMKGEQTNQNGVTKAFELDFPYGQPTESEMNEIHNQLVEEFKNNTNRMIITWGKKTEAEIIPIINEVELDFQNPIDEDTSYYAYWECPKCNTNSINNWSKYCFECGSKINWINKTENES